MGLIAGNVGGKAAIEVFRCLAVYRGGHGFGYIMGLIAGNVGGKASLIVFNLLTADFFGRGAVGFYFIGAVHALGEGDCLSCAAIGFAHNAVGEIFGDGEGFGTISYSNLSFFCILADGGGLAFDHCFVFHGEGAVVIADHFSGDVLLGAFWFCVIAQVLADFFRPYDGFSCGVYDPFISSDGDRAAVFIENGFCTVVHSANLVIDFGCHIAAINGSVVIFCIHRAGECLGIEFAFYRKVARHAQVAFHFCIAGNGQGTANGSVALCINCKVSIRPFDGAIVFQSCASMVIIIATGIEPVFVHDSTIQAHFDALIAEGNPVWVIFIQHQFVHSRFAVVFNHGNHTVTINFEVILVGLFASSFFSRHCIGIGLDLRIQVSKIFVYFFAYL